MREASEKGCPVIRPLFYHFPSDPEVWDIDDAFLFGDQILVAPITEYQQRKRDVYLPAGASWTEYTSGKVYQGGQTICVDAPLEVIPIFLRDKSHILDIG